MNTVKDLIAELRAVYKERGYNYDDVLKLLEPTGYQPSKSTLSRLFSEGSTWDSFNYEWTLLPIANVLLDVANTEDDDVADVKAMKALLRYKAKRIEELEATLNHEKVKYHEKLDREREKHQKSIDFLKHQIDLKDKRMDQLLDAVFKRDEQHANLMEHIINCPYRQKGANM